VRLGGGFLFIPRPPASKIRKQNEIETDTLVDGGVNPSKYGDVEKVGADFAVDP
jgi:pentose-5-phosphate-3-epimerase